MERTLFDWQETTGRDLRDEAIERVRENADEDWFARALAAVRNIARDRKELTTDDVWECVEATREGRAMGAVMTEASRQRWIVRTDRTLNSRRKENHSRPIRVWQSLIYGKGDTGARHDE